ncbi:hypothetical protein Tco_1081895 [Tanacetum coccineum]|uniref:Uncharacterized protein n=1 Tax=Tanacetum coccineum TaxID=301880 RepID=A0ABQ5HZ84_9ASTR
MTCKVLLHHYGRFTSPPGRKFVGRMVAIVDPVELDNFSTNQDIAKVDGKLQLFVSHYHIDLSTVLILNVGSLEESFAGIRIFERWRRREQERSPKTNKSKHGVERAQSKVIKIRRIHLEG